MKKTLYISFISLVVLTLNSCATAPSKHIPEHFSAKESHGLVIGTIAIKDERPRFNGYFLYYSEEGKENVNLDRMIAIQPEQIIKMKFKPDFFDEGKAVYYYAIEMAPGRHSFTMMRLFENGGQFQSNERIPIDVPFTSVSGKITYVGQLELDYRDDRRIKLIDKSERDLPTLKKKYPNIDWNRLINDKQ